MKLCLLMDRVFSCPFPGSSAVQFGAVLYTIISVSIILAAS